MVFDATMTMTRMDEITAAAEVWHVDADETQAMLIDGVYGAAEALGFSRDGLVLHAGQGLAGAVLARRVPVLLRELDREAFEGSEAAAASGVVAAIGIPVFDEEKLTAVLVVMFRGNPGMVGGVELWVGRRGRVELGLTEAYYAGLERFGKISKYVNFPIGSGLPGMAWAIGAPRLITGLGKSQAFLRSSGAESAGLVTGFGVPIVHRNELLAVMLWLSSRATPLARWHQVWESSDGRVESLRCVAADGVGSGEVKSEKLKVKSREGVGSGGAELQAAITAAVREAGQRRMPVVFDDVSAQGLEGVGLGEVKSEKLKVKSVEGEQGNWGGAKPQAAGWGGRGGRVLGGFALPVLRHDGVRAVGVMAW